MEWGSWSSLPAGSLPAVWPEKLRQVGKGFCSRYGGSKKKMGVAILISNKIDFKLKSIKRDGQVQFILITGNIHQDEVSILNIYVPNTRAPIYVKETLLKLK